VELRAHIDTPTHPGDRAPSVAHSARLRDVQSPASSAASAGRPTPPWMITRLALITGIARSRSSSISTFRVMLELGPADPRLPHDHRRLGWSCATFTAGEDQGPSRQTDPHPRPAGSPHHRRLRGRSHRRRNGGEPPTAEIGAEDTTRRAHRGSKLRSRMGVARTARAATRVRAGRLCFRARASTRGRGCTQRYAIVELPRADLADGRRPEIIPVCSRSPYCCAWTASSLVRSGADYSG
jgi:hypothetical protein